MFDLCMGMCKGMERTEGWESPVIHFQSERRQDDG